MAHYLIFFLYFCILKRKKKIFQVNSINYTSHMTSRRLLLIAAIILHCSFISTRGAAQEVPTDSTYNDSIPWQQALQQRLDSIIGTAGMLNTSQMGFMVYDLTDDSVLYARDERQTLRPASTMKLITAITALDKLGSGYEFRTTVKYTGELTDSTRTLTGNIYLIGGMDPKIGSDDLHAIALALREAGIETIRGNIYADRSMRDDIMYGEGWCWDDKNPILSALAYQRKDDFAEQLARVLPTDSVTHVGSIGAMTCPKGAKQITCLTHTMNDILIPMLKNSNNMYAESMYYQIGLTQGKPSTAKKAKAVEEALLKKLGLGDAIHRFADGSGLSLYNYVSAEIEVAFLRYAYGNKAIYDALYPALPIAAVDGTIKDRMAGTPAAGNVHAKTGTLTGISSLAGYCTAPNGHTLCFAIINQGVMHTIYAKNLQDKLCAAMCAE